MVKRIQNARSRGVFEREERLASETLEERRRNTAPGARNEEQEDYDEENVSLQSATKDAGKIETIPAGAYEDDYGAGAKGRRDAGQVGAKNDPTKVVLPRKERTLHGDPEDRDDFPTGKWSRQKMRAKILTTPTSARRSAASSQQRRRTTSATSDKGRSQGRPTRSPASARQARTNLAPQRKN